jgi:hypothetical protein
MASPKSVVKVVALSAGGLVASCVLVITAFALWMHLSHQATLDDATAFCAATAPGAPIADVAARAQAESAWYLPNDSGVHVVRFSGWGRSDCTLTVVGGRVTATAVTSEAYD